MHRCHRFFQASLAPWNSDTGMLFKTRVDLFHGAGTVAFHITFHTGTKKKVGRSQVRAVRRLRHCCNFVFSQHLGRYEGGVAGRVVLMEDPIVGNLRTDSADPKFQPAQHSCVKLSCWRLSSRNELTVYHPFRIKKDNEHALHLGFGHASLFRL